MSELHGDILSVFEKERFRRVSRTWNDVFSRNMPSIRIYNISLFDEFIDIAFKRTDKGEFRFYFDEDLVRDGNTNHFPFECLKSFARHIAVVDMLMVGLDSKFDALSRLDTILQLFAGLKGKKQRSVNELAIWLVQDIEKSKSQLSIIPVFADSCTKITVLTA
ncbi:unnamed protein product [Anisakis simplex]|uniref:F-box domain-containing protein n=1 Tax=Anisakis simplex TaxID=6269 RepID=A0A3P6N6P4_ANISI|nr:unnamed protein product [Anisakis simplex]